MKEGPARKAGREVRSRKQRVNSASVGEIDDAQEAGSARMGPTTGSEMSSGRLSMKDAVKQGTASEMGQGTAVPPSEAGRKSCVWELGSWSKASSRRQKIVVTALRYIWREAIACGMVTEGGWPRRWWLNRIEGVQHEDTERKTRNLARLGIEMKVVTARSYARRVSARAAMASAWVAATKQPARR